jgi:hypothetical protein
MTTLTRPDQIWRLVPRAEDLDDGARYAEITLPWTFDRMMKGITSQGLQRRALNIAKGVVAQKVLRREFKRRGICAPEEEKSYRTDDLFDFRVDINHKEQKLDIKSINYYTNVNPLGREPFSPELLIANAGYPGPEWAHFFPMMLPHTQIGQDKEAYCFAIASSIDFRRDVDTNRTAYALTAFPYGVYGEFLSKKRMVERREAAGQGVYIECDFKSYSLFGGDGVELTILGEWDGETVKKQVTLKPGAPVRDIGPFSGVTSFQVSREHYDLLEKPNCIEVSVTRSDYTETVRNSKRENVNVIPDEVLTITRTDFCNLILPSDYTVYYLGWITKEEFKEKCRNYPAWIWPNDKKNDRENQPWSQMTERDLANLKKTSFDDRLTDKPRGLNAGWLKATPAGSAACYVYPNQFRGGLNETNLYVLPQDLHLMDSLGK